MVKVTTAGYWIGEATEVGDYKAVYRAFEVEGITITGTNESRKEDVQRLRGRQILAYAGSNYAELSDADEQAKFAIKGGVAKGEVGALKLLLSGELNLDTRPYSQLEIKGIAIDWEENKKEK